MRIDDRGRVRERRKKRLLTPLVYFIAELTVIGLVLVILEMSFDVRAWSVLSYLIFAIVFFYGLMKTIYIYERQRDYSE